MVHPRFDLPAWERRHPLDEAFKATRRDWRGISHASSPATLALIEQTRREIWPNLHQYPNKPCDLFVWAWGEPTHRWATKIGGVPYLDRFDSWPVDGNDSPMGFVYQIHFQDSLDLVGHDLPGDTLLFFSSVHVSGNSVYLTFDESDPTTHHFRWMKSGNVRRPVTRLPDTGLDLWPLHGAIHRTFDVPELDYHALQAVGKLNTNDPLYCDGFPPAIWKATKIGGEPHWEQGVDLGMTLKGGRFLCQVPSDNANISAPDPYLGHPKPMDMNPHNVRGRRLTVGDLGSMHLFFVDGHIHACSQS